MGSCHFDLRIFPLFCICAHFFVGWGDSEALIGLMVIDMFHFGEIMVSFIDRYIEKNTRFWYGLNVLDHFLLILLFFYVLRKFWRVFTIFLLWFISVISEDCSLGFISRALLVKSCHLDHLFLILALLRMRVTKVLTNYLLRDDLKFLLHGPVTSSTKGLR